MFKKQIIYEGIGVNLRIYYNYGHIWGGRILLNCDIKEINEENFNDLIENLEDIKSLLIKLKDKNI